jgi:hypothetical protein
MAAGIIHFPGDINYMSDLIIKNGVSDTEQEQKSRRVT